MKIKNLGTTVFNIGDIVILPDETAEIDNKAYQNNAVIEYLVRTNRLALVKDKAKNTVRNKDGETE